MKRHILSILLTLTMLLGLLPVGTLAAKGGSDFIVPVQQKTEVPRGYTAITNEEELRAVSKNMTGKYILMNDIKVTGSWLPIQSSEDDAFRGVFDGNGYTISGLYYYGFLDNGKTLRLGLFECVRGGLVSDLKVSGEFTVEPIQTYARADIYAGGIAGEIEEGAILNNCVSDVKVTVAQRFNMDDDCGVGGLVGALHYGDVSIQYCRNLNNVTGPWFTGGMAGYAEARSGEVTLFAC